MDPLSNPPPPIVPRKKRRWWLWVLCSLGGLAVLGVAVVLAVVSYYHTLIERHTQKQALVLAKVDASPSAAENVRERFSFFQQALLNGRDVEPLRLSADDLNLLLANINELKDRVRVQIEDEHLEAVFSLPLDKSNKRELKGRYLNGVATLDLQLQDDGFLALHVAEVKANGHLIPRWLLSKISQHDLIGFLSKNADFLDMLTRLDDVSVKGDSVVFLPLQTR